MMIQTEKHSADKWADRTFAVDLILTEDEEAALTAKAAQLGLTPEEYVRTRLGFTP